MDDAIEWFAPGRVNLIGEHTDYNAGLALPMAIQMGCRCVLRRRPEGVLTISSRQTGSPVRVPMGDLRPGMAWADGDGWAAYVAGVVWAGRERSGRPWTGGGLDIEIAADLPIGAGLSSSAAMCCAVAGAVLDVLAPEPPLGADRDRIAELAFAAEAEFVGAPTGHLDQTAVTMGRAGHVMLCDFRDQSIEQVPFDPAASGLAMVAVDTGAPHAHVSGEYAERRRACEQACAELGVSSLREATADDLGRLPAPVLRRRARHVLTENERVESVAGLLRVGRIAEIGPHLTASHDSMRVDFEVTVPRVDQAVEALLGAGALGARMTGGGFGGCVIGLGPADRARPMIEAVRQRIGAQLWATTMTASAGVRRLPRHP